MPFDPLIAATRFGTGLSPVLRPPESAEAMITRLAGPDTVAANLPISGFEATVPSLATFQAANAAVREAKGTPREEAAQQAARALRIEISAVRQHNTLTTFARGVAAADGFRERMTAFWADHFTVKSKAVPQRHLIAPYVEDAIRPHVAGRFGDMLSAVVLHPMMLTYLEQVRSVGPDSKAGRRTGRGLNENLARELLELHLVGANGGYDQVDVTQLAELLTGLSYTSRGGFDYRADWAEPGAEVVMGRRYPAAADLSSVTAALQDLAVRPQTAAHLARKMAVHFVADDPDPALVAGMSDAYLGSGGDLLAMSSAMLAHPAAWSQQRMKVRRPDLFITAALRALGTRARAVLDLRPGAYQQHITGALALMGQPLESPVGPDGWSEAAADWITPQGLAARISWALRSPAVFVDPLPDPRQFVQTALGGAAPPEVVFAAGAAEKLSDGIGVVLTSPAFQRI